MTDSRKPISIALTTLLYIIFFCLMVWVIGNKINFHEDEIFTYVQANSRNATYLQIIDAKKYTPPSSAFWNHLTADKDDRFDFRNVWENEREGVHPPLFHSLVHAVCSVFYGRFSKWYAGIINIIFLLMTLCAARKITSVISGGDEKILFAVSAFVVFSTGILSSASYLRMYCMAMFWNTMICLLLMTGLSEEDPSWKFYVKLFPVIILGALTHYYCIVFTVFSCAVYGIILLIRKRYKGALKLCLLGCVSGAVYLCIWPAVIEHLTSSFRGVEAVKNFSEPLTGFFLKAEDLYDVIIEDLYGKSRILFCVLFMMILFFSILLKLRPAGKKKTESADIAGISCEQVTGAERFVLLWIPVLLYVLLIAKIAPYRVDRYIFPVYALIITGTYGFLFSLMKKLIAEKICMVLVCVLFLVVAYSEWMPLSFQYQYRDSADILEKSKKFQESDCLVIYSYYWEYYSSLLEISNYRSVTFLDAKELEKIKITKLPEADDLVVIAPISNKKLLKKIKRYFPRLNRYEKIGSFYHNDTWYFYSDEDL